MVNSEIGNPVMLDLYQSMIRIRFFENAVRRLMGKGLVPARFGLYTGQEGVAVGISAHLTPMDQIGSTHRPLGHLIAKGCDLNKLMAEICGKGTGFNKGKAGPYHVFDPSVGVLGANGIVGASVPMAAGYALANQFKGNSSVSVAYFGDGGSNQGGVQETLNLAACWNLPIIFVCENSSTRIQRMLGHEIDYPQLNIENISTRALGYGMPGSTHRGWEVLEVYRAAGDAIIRARRGLGPTLLEFKVHQTEGNLEGRIEENKAERMRCPISLFRTKLIQGGIMKENDDEGMRREERLLVDEAVEYAKRSPDPELKEAYTDIFNGD
jgi:pyruvate dehydrogenase E1 component alpha subunit